VTRDEILTRGLEDAAASLGILEATLRQAKMAPVAELVREMRNKASAALARADSATDGVSPCL